ncbi:MAG TPA: YceD family protein [Nevskiales bacterium]|nr:YceD family protein [Nevskiales bacterium]
MFGVLPDRIAPDQLLADGGRLHGTLPLKRLLRLGELAPQPAGEASADLTLCLDAQGRYWLEGRLHADLVLRCERCLGTLVWPVDATLGLFLAASEQAAAALSEDADYVLAGESLGVLELIEDELILALPLVPRHPPGTECGDRAGKGPVAESGERDSPFAILKQLRI